MNESQLEALVAAAQEGIALDDLRVEADDDRYVFETPEARHEDLAEQDLRAVATENPWYVSNWFYWTRGIDTDDGARRAFLRWIEGAPDRSVHDRYRSLADGVTRSWGQLAVTATLGDHGWRRYHVRHEDDRGVPLRELTVHADPLDARKVATDDDRGRYRPLKTAPSLRTGWAFTDLDGRELVRTVDRFYPATIENWHRERTGTLDVCHWRETAERQTGIYDLVDELPAEAVEWAAEATCVDSQCLKRREWDLDETSELATERGEGAFPCREPCSLLVAAAREWALLEREEPRTYEFELTPSEKEQLEELIDAVADGRVDEIREADFGDGANRYRTRYLRAKRMDEDGRLSGTQTDGGT